MKMSVHSFVIRIYRNNLTTDDQFVGTIEGAGQQAPLVFFNVDELKDALIMCTNDSEFSLLD